MVQEDGADKNRNTKARERNKENTTQDKTEDNKTEQEPDNNIANKPQYREQDMETEVPKHEVQVHHNCCVANTSDAISVEETKKP